MPTGPKSSSLISGLKPRRVDERAEWVRERVSKRVGRVEWRCIVLCFGVWVVDVLVLLCFGFFCDCVCFS